MLSHLGHKSPKTVFGEEHDIFKRKFKKKNDDSFFELLRNHRLNYGLPFKAK